MIGFEEIKKHCMNNLAVRNHEGNGTVELYDNAERRRIGLHNLKANQRYYGMLGDKYKKFRQRIERLVLTMQEPIDFIMIKEDKEIRVQDADTLTEALRLGYVLSESMWRMPQFYNPCGEIKLGSWETANQWRDASSYSIGGSPYSKHLSPSQLRMVARGAWRRLNLAGRDSVIVESLPHIKISKSVLQKLQHQTHTEPARELVYAFYNQSRQPQWWQQLRSYRAGLRDQMNLQMYALFVADFLYDALGPQIPMPNEWKTSTVLGLLRTMRESEDFSPMPILADALQDAGCENESLLNHYRLASTFTLGSWIFRATGLI